MIKVKFKICAGCGPGKIIYSNIDGKAYCKDCAKRIAPSKPIRHRSAKRVVLDQKYSVKSTAFKDKDPCCKARITSECKGCNREYATVQHLAGRIGDDYLNEDGWMTICFFCHQWVNEHPKMAIELKLAKSRLN